MAVQLQIVSGGPLDVNTYVLGCEGEETCLLIDPGAEENSVQEAVGNRRVTAVLLTHAHFDHMFFAKSWLDKGAKLYVHELDARAITDPTLNLSSYMGDVLTLRKPDVLLREGDTVSEAGLNLSVLHTPGHTPGCVSFLLDKMLFSGDTMFYGSYGRIDFPGGSGIQMLESLKRLGELPEDTIVYPGHGMKTKIAWERGRFQ